jgi:hypothetical protein
MSKLNSSISFMTDKYRGERKTLKGGLTVSLSASQTMLASKMYWLHGDVASYDTITV